MIKMYLNSPRSRAMIHRDPMCPEIHKNQKTSQRDVTVNRQSFSDVISRMSSKTFQFASNPSANDAWITVDFDDAEFEQAVARYIHRIIGHRYKTIRDSELEMHTCG